VAVTPVLKRFSIRILKDNGSGGQVPAAGATVSFYKQGATVKTAVSVYVDPVDVYNTGVLEVGDVVQVGADSTKTLRVDAVNQDANNVALFPLTGAPFGLAVDDRLIRIKKAGSPSPVPDPALIYVDSLGASGGAGSKNADSDGWVEGYVGEYRFDYIVAGAGAVDRVFSDEVGSFVLR